MNRAPLSYLALLSLLASQVIFAQGMAPDPAARLAAAWEALHPGQQLPPACPHPDPTRELVADFDSGTPGAETALASLRFGVVLLTAKGQPLANLPLQCGDATSTQSAPSSEVVELKSLRASGLAPHDILLRTRQVGRCGHIVWWQLLHRQGKSQSLETLLTTEEEVSRVCGSGPHEQSTTHFEVQSVGLLRAHVEGTESKPQPDGNYSPPMALHRRTHYRLAASGRFVASSD